MLISFLFCFGTIYSPVLAEDETLRIFKLVNADCGEMGELLDRISDGGLTLAADARTNSLVVMGDEETLSVIESILLKLDQPTEDKRPNRGKPSAEMELEEKVQQERMMALERIERIEEAKLEQHQKLEVESNRASVERQVEFLSRKAEMAVAEAKLEQFEMETEINAKSQMLEALNVRLSMAKARNEAPGDRREEFAMLKAEHAVTSQSIELQKMKLDFHIKHVAPMRKMEIELKLHETHRMLEAMHAKGK